MLESKRKALLFFILAFLLAVIAGFMFLQKIKNLNNQLGEMTKIYVAADNISSRSTIQPSQIKTEEIPKRYSNSSYITNKQYLMNKVSVVPLSKGDIITKSMLKPIVKVRSANDRLVTMYASDRVRFDQKLQSLDRVDIIVNQSFSNKPVTTVFMTDVKIAMVAMDGNQLKGVALEIPFDKVAQFIHMETYADSIRVLKANVGKPSTMTGDLSEGNKQPKQQNDQTKQKKSSSNPSQPNQSKDSTKKTGKGQ